MCMMKGRSTGSGYDDLGWVEVGMVVKRVVELIDGFNGY